MESKTNLDKFYTKPELVDKCIETISNIFNWEQWSLIIEPSAGSGNFYKKIPVKNKIGIDIVPEDGDIIKQDFFTYKPCSNTGKILVIGNPPFGRVSSLAIKFFNHSAEFADNIAFIIPRTFRKTSVQNRLNLNFHLIMDEEIGTKPCNFYPEMMVKCCFQIWVKKEYKRKVEKLQLKHNDWDFLLLGPKDNNGQPTVPSKADFVIRAYGGNCGEIKEDNLSVLRPKSWHWIRSNINKSDLISRFKKLDYSNCKNTARQNSIGKAELIELYNKLKYK